MEKEQVMQAIAETPKGANIILAWERPAHVKKNVLDNIRKAVVAVGRIGVEYDHLKAVQEKRENGELPAENAGLKGMEWVQYPFILRSLKTGKLLLRLAKGTSKTTHPCASWTKNGEPVSKEEIAPSLLAKELAPNEGDCLTVCLDDLIRIHAEVAEVAEVKEQPIMAVAPKQAEPAQPAQPAEVGQPA